jgi:hypothetical protein
MEKITEDNFEEILFKRHPKLMSKQPKQDIEDNLDIMAKKMTKEQLDALSEVEESIGKPGAISNSVIERKNKYEPEIYEKKEKFIWDLMAFGLQCRKGWFYLIDAVMDVLDGHVETISEVKEKYGRLQIYLYGDDYGYEIESIASDLSESICEECGKQITKKTMYENAKNHKPNSWVYTLCDTCIMYPQKSFPMSDNHVKKTEIKKYFLDTDYSIVNVTDFIKMAKNGTIDKKLLITMKGSVLQIEKDWFFEDDTGRIKINQNSFDFYKEGACTLNNCYPVFNNGEITLDFYSIKSY